jgi:hypothetical protein
MVIRKDSGGKVGAMTFAPVARKYSTPTQMIAPGVPIVATKSGLFGKSTRLILSLFRNSCYDTSENSIGLFRGIEKIEWFFTYFTGIG